MRKDFGVAYWCYDCGKWLGNSACIKEISDVNFVYYCYPCYYDKIKDCLDVLEDDDE